MESNLEGEIKADDRILSDINDEEVINLKGEDLTDKEKLVLQGYLSTAVRGYIGCDVCGGACDGCGCNARDEIYPVSVSGLMPENKYLIKV